MENIARALSKAISVPEMPSFIQSCRSLVKSKALNAKYFGDKIHYDQNEKLGMLGVANVCAQDGFSGKIVQHAIDCNVSTFLMVRVFQKKLR